MEYNRCRRGTVNYKIKGQKVYINKLKPKVNIQKYMPRTKLEAIINTIQTKTNKHQKKRTDSELTKQKTKQTIIIKNKNNTIIK